MMNDATGYLCLNIAQPGIVLDLDLPKEMQDIYAKLPPRSPPPSSFSAATRKLQAKVKTFMDAQLKAWREAPAAETELVATDEVFEEVYKSATAFHCNAAGRVDTVWLKKDMPREALKHAEVGYWLESAGPAPQYEQLEVKRARDIPSSVLDNIRETNDHLLIAGWIYAFIDFWCIVLRHYLIIIACIFFFGYLCLLEPTLIIVESSKLTNLFLTLPPMVVFQRPLDNARFLRFLAGRFTLACVYILGITKCKIIWEDLPLLPPDWIRCIGVPIIVPYGPLPFQLCIMIPKADPYRHYHTLTQRIAYVRLDRAVRAMVELGDRLTMRRGPAPANATREAWLMGLKDEIFREAKAIGLWSQLQHAKADCAEAQFAFNHYRALGMDKRGDQEARRQSRSNNGKEAQKKRRLNGPVAVGAPASPERQAFVVLEINKLRRIMEKGQCVRLFPCPTQFLHGSNEHANWLYKHNAQGVDLIASATGFSQFGMPELETEQEQAARADLQDKCGEGVAVDNVQQISGKDALFLLASSEGRAGTSVALKYKALHVHCKLCDSHWLAKTSQKARLVHTCPAARAIALPLYAAHLMHKESETADAQDYEEEEDVQLAASVTRSLNARVFPWTTGSSIGNGDSAVWDTKKKPAPPRAKRWASPTDPAYEQVMDHRLRLRVPKLDVEEFIYPFQLLQCPHFAADLLDTATGSPLFIQGLNYHELPAFYKLHREALKREPYTLSRQKVNGAPSSSYVVTLHNDASQQAKDWSYRQATAATEQVETAVKRGAISLAEVEAAVLDRISIGECRPLFYDAVNNVDKMLQQKKEKPVLAVLAAAASPPRPVAPIRPPSSPATRATASPTSAAAAPGPSTSTSSSRPATGPSAPLKRKLPSGIGKPVSQLTAFVEPPPFPTYPPGFRFRPSFENGQPAHKKKRYDTVADDSGNDEPVASTSTSAPAVAPPVPRVRLPRTIGRSVKDLLSGSKYAAPRLSSGLGPNV